jgi:hypothetical protein
MFAYANVPYRLKSYEEIVANPKNSIRFDDELHVAIEKLEKTYGADAKLMLNPEGEVMLVSFTEKLLATLLAKLSNFIPEAGIWMNTLRPEWNDANNALVGTGASMVTLYYMRRFVAFASELYQNSPLGSFNISAEMVVFLDEIFSSFRDNSFLLEKGFDNQTRRVVADELGKAGENYRSKIYNSFTQKKQVVSKQELLDFFDLALEYIDQSIAVNKRTDYMYHAYNLVSFQEDSVAVRHLYEMLEGQVAVLSSGKLNEQEALELLDALRNSSLYRPDQNSYILYPNKKLPVFLEKNNIAPEVVTRIKLLEELVAKGDSRIITTDSKGGFHFNAGFNNAGFLREALEKLKNDAAFTVTEADMQEIETAYEQIFDHHSFTGRSGTFYKYEGLGCIYWHMVSKLLLAIGENIRWATEKGADKAVIAGLEKHYFEVKAGIGAHKSPAVYGSFPFDPYSHTPTMAGVQQPGMTGQVKEDIISRFFELGVHVVDGCLKINPVILKQEEFFRISAETPYLSFSYCSVPFVYMQNGKTGMEIIYSNGKSEKINGYLLNSALSQAVFNRDKKIQKIVVCL